MDPQRQLMYQSIIGSVNFLATVAWPDLSFPVSMLSSYNANPSEQHLRLAYQALRYIRQGVNDDMSMIIKPVPPRPNEPAVVMYAEHNMVRTLTTPSHFQGM